MNNKETLKKLLNFINDILRTEIVGEQIKITIQYNHNNYDYTLIKTEYWTRNFTEYTCFKLRDYYNKNFDRNIEFENIQRVWINDKLMFDNGVYGYVADYKPTVIFGESIPQRYTYGIPFFNEKNRGKYIEVDKEWEEIIRIPTQKELMIK